MTLFDLPGLFSIPFGILTDRFGPKRLGAVSIFIVGLGSFIVASSHSFVMVLIGRLAGGIGSAWTAVVTLAIISQWFPSTESGIAMGVYGLGLPIAIVTGFNAFGRLGIAYGWRFAFYLVTINCFMVLGLFVGFVRDGQGVRTSTHEDRITNLISRKRFTNRDLWKVSLYWFLFNAAWYSFSAWAPTLLSEYKGISLASAGTLSSLPMIISLPCMPLFGWLSDRLNSGRSLMLIGSGLMTVAFLIIPGTGAAELNLAAVAIGVGFSMVPPIVFSLAGDALGPKSAGTSFGILNSCGGVGAALGPLLLGFVQDLTGSLTCSFAVVATIEALCCICALSCPCATSSGRYPISSSSTSTSLYHFTLSPRIFRALHLSFFRLEAREAWIKSTLRINSSASIPTH